MAAYVSRGRSELEHLKGNRTEEDEARMGVWGTWMSTGDWHGCSSP